MQVVWFCEGFSLVLEGRGYILVVVCELLVALFAEHRLSGTRASVVTPAL